MQVFLHDPLYRWTVTVTKAHRTEEAMQRRLTGNPGETVAEGAEQKLLANADASWAILRVKLKLDGKDSSEAEPHTVESQVAWLLATARDRDLLCRMYAPWGAFL